MLGGPGKDFRFLVLGKISWEILNILGGPGKDFSLINNNILTAFSSFSGGPGKDFPKC